MWRRYLSGTAAGLIWLGGDVSQPIDRRVAMAQNLVGTSLHAIQDFYSHSNWIDDDHLRTQTWFEVDPDLRACLSLWTGSYEQPEHLGILPHGAFVYACGVINRFGSAGRGLMNVVCHAASPFADSSLCRWFKQCENSEPLQQPPDGWGSPVATGRAVGGAGDQRRQPLAGRGRRRDPRPESSDLGGGGVRSCLQARLSQFLPVAPHPRAPRHGRRSARRVLATGQGRRCDRRPVRDADRTVGGLRPAPVPVHLGGAVPASGT